MGHGQRTIETSFFRYGWCSRLGRSFRVGLNQPLGGTGLSDPDSRGIVVVALALRFVVGPAVEGIDDMIRGESRVRREDANLEIAELVGLELAVLQVNEESVDGLDLVVNFNEIPGEKTANGGEVPLGHRGPEMLFEVDDFNGGGV